MRKDGLGLIFIGQYVEQTNEKFSDLSTITLKNNHNSNNRNKYEFATRTGVVCGHRRSFKTIVDSSTLNKNEKITLILDNQKIIRSALLRTEKGNTKFITNPNYIFFLTNIIILCMNVIEILTF